MDTANFKKRYIMIPLLFLCLLLCGCHGNIIGNLMASEHTELLVDGEYKPFNVPRNTMEALMKLVEAKDANTIYEVFSPEVRENAEGLYGQVQEFIRFIEEDVTSWDFLSGYGNGNRSGGSVTMTRASFCEFSTDSGIYRCDIGEVLKDTVQPDLVGFSDITVYPDELSWEYAPKSHWAFTLYTGWRISHREPTEDRIPWKDWWNLHRRKTRTASVSAFPCRPRESQRTCRRKCRSWRGFCVSGWLPGSITPGRRI